MKQNCFAAIKGKIMLAIHISKIVYRIYVALHLIQIVCDDIQPQIRVL